MKQDDIRDQLNAHLKYFSDIGVKFVNLPQNGQDRSNQSPDALEDLWNNHVKGCTKCPLAQCGRQNIVFGGGNPNADIMFIGEGPGRDEDIQGIPFVGRAGQKLNEIIHAMGMDRKDVYIANIVKCRPPGNRNPEAEETAACIPYLEEQIKIIKPKAICTLGSIATHNLLNEKTPISRMRGNFYEYMGIPVMPTFHPAYLLRNYTPTTRKQVWEDVQKILVLIRENKQPENC